MPHTTTNWFAAWAPFIARLIFGSVFLFSATGKIPGTELYAANVAATAMVGVPLPHVAVILALILEVVGALMLILGWHARLAAMAFIPYVALLTVLFHLSFAGPTEIGFFVDHFVFMAGLLYVAVYGAEHIALQRDVP